MPLFIFTCLLVSYIARTQSPYQDLFTSEFTLISGITVMVISLTGAVLKKLSYRLWYDLFASGLLLTWFALWHRHYAPEAPMFYVFPLFFAFLTALFNILFISKKNLFDQESIEQLAYFEKMTGFHPGLIIAGLIASLFLRDHYLLFPALVGVYIVRFTVTSCLDQR